MNAVKVARDVIIQLTVRSVQSYITELFTQMKIEPNALRNAQKDMFQIVLRTGIAEISIVNVHSIRTENVFHRIRHAHKIACLVTIMLNAQPAKKVISS
jgi:hypothetical protein